MTNPRSAVISLAVLLLLAGAGCGSSPAPLSDVSPTPSSTPTAAAAVSPPPAATGAVTAVKEVNAIGMGGAFDPPMVAIKAGGSVRWTNSSGNIHNVTFADASIKASGVMSPGESFDTVFARPGTYSYRCTFHPGMEGTVVVGAG